MKAIILAAGEGTRLRPLTLETPKAMVEVFGKPLLAHNMDKLLAYVDEFILVVKYKEEKVREYFGENYKGIPISYHTQGNKKGTAGALEGIEIAGDCFVLASDTIFHQSDIDTLAKHTGYAVLAKQVENPEKYGIFQVGENNRLIQVVEKPQEYIGNLASLFYFKVNSEIISLAEKLDISPRGEYELTDALNGFAGQFEVQVLEIQEDYIDITSGEDLQKAHDILSISLGTTRYIENIGENSLHVGIQAEHIESIIEYSQNQEDAALQKNTSDLKRFGSEETLETWYKDPGRIVFSLLSPEGILLGIVYYRPSKNPNIIEEVETEMCEKIKKGELHISTGGIRLYPIARGKGLASNFLTVTERVYKNVFPSTYICIDIEQENIPSQRAFEKAGYIFIGYGENQKTVQNETHKRMVYIK